MFYVVIHLFTQHIFTDWLLWAKHCLFSAQEILQGTKQVPSLGVTHILVEWWITINQPNKKKIHDRADGRNTLEKNKAGKEVRSAEVGVILSRMVGKDSLRR